MPTYSYRCTECTTAFDIHQEFADDALTTCPTCAGRLRKVYGPLGVSFQGSGFYRTDSRSGSSAPSPSDSGSGSSAPSAPAASPTPTPSSAASTST